MGVIQRNWFGKIGKITSFSVHISNEFHRRPAQGSLLRLGGQRQHPQIPDPAPNAPGNTTSLNWGIVDVRCAVLPSIPDNCCTEIAVCEKKWDRLPIPPARTCKITKKIIKVGGPDGDAILFLLPGGGGEEKDIAGTFSARKQQTSRQRIFRISSKGLQRRKNTMAMKNDVTAG